MHQFAVSVVLPAKNEAKNLSVLLREISEVVPSTTTEIIVVDDGSSDDSLSLLRNLSSTLPVSFRVIVHPLSCGQSTSVFHGVLQAKGKWIITLDADGQNDPADIPRLIRAAKETNAAHFCVIGHRQKRKDTPWKRFQSKVANRIRQWILQDDTPDTGCGLKLLPRSTFLLLPYFDHMHRYIPALTKRLGGEVVCISVNHRARLEGKSNYTAWNRGWAGIIDMLGVRWLMYRNKLNHIASGIDHEN
ncbi:glycosyltransferase family 2 protein [Alteromonas sp. ALT199]|uniref:glycosyltransferase family 2 protein n=1 Tax=unclassified Alteromonas TaxID=2614992 RepID=UPI00044BA5BB|nr:glycosyltransferase family 2 protein [Alteromonas sp. ALT199]MBT3133704.1 glycosyltransferase family 2 protein [Alteromonas sp. ALT199]